MCEAGYRLGIRHCPPEPWLKLEVGGSRAHDVGNRERVPHAPKHLQDDPLGGLSDRSASRVPTGELPPRWVLGELVWSSHHVLGTGLGARKLTVSTALSLTALEELRVGDC